MWKAIFKIYILVVGKSLTYPKKKKQKRESPRANVVEFVCLLQKTKVFQNNMRNKNSTKAISI